MRATQKDFVTPKTARQVTLGFIVGWLLLVFFFVAYWIKLLLDNQNQAFVPNYETRIETYKFSTQNPRPGAFWIF